MPDIRVRLMKRTGREFFECQWNDPTTGKLKTKSTGTKLRREAERFAGALQAKLIAGEDAEQRNALWSVLADRYEAEALGSGAEKTRAKFRATRNAIDELISPKFANALTSSIVSKYQAALREKGLEQATIKGHLSALRACLNWGFKTGLIRKVPHFEMPKRTSRMKGRPITAEEFERMVDAVGKCLPEDYAGPWRSLLNGLWLSGLRLDEALRLTWHTGGFAVNLTSQRPRFKIEANEDKSKKVRLLPMTPDFAEFLLAIPENRRRGNVFRPIVPNQVAETRLDTCSKVITRFGKKAAIVVNERPPKPGSEVMRKKWASAHDLRRAFGTRWAKKVRPQQLQQLMRHESITTTMTFYVEHDIEELENATWSEMPQTTNGFTNSQSFGDNQQPAKHD